MPDPDDAPAPEAPEPAPPVNIPDIDFSQAPEGVEMTEVRKGFGFGEVGPTGGHRIETPEDPGDSSDS
jgi:hypothetical protein